MFKFKMLASAAAIITSASLAFADTWTLNGEASHLAFGSIKKESFGEVHSFSGLSGSVSPDGKVMLEIDLATLDTQIEIRDERMKKHVFNNTPKATVMAEIEMENVSELAVGDSTVVDAYGTVALAGNETEVFTEMFVMRLNEEQVLVTTNGMIMLNLEDFGLTKGIDMLMQIAELPSITRASPVTMRLIFDRTAKEAGLGQKAPQGG
ncbi:MAG: YceI family protein [Pseudomonadota bacterium]